MGHKSEVLGVIKYLKHAKIQQFINVVRTLAADFSSYVTDMSCDAEFSQDKGIKYMTLGQVVQYFFN